MLINFFSCFFLSFHAFPANFYCFDIFSVVRRQFLYWFFIMLIAYLYSFEFGWHFCFFMPFLGSFLILLNLDEIFACCHTTALGHGGFHFSSAAYSIMNISSLKLIFKNQFVIFFMLLNFDDIFGAWVSFFIRRLFRSEYF